MQLVSEREGRHLALAVATIVLAFAALFAARAQAAELIYWDNYGSTPQSISVASINGSGGGTLNLSGVTLEDPEGMAIDTITNRLFVVSTSGGADGKGEILAVSLDGSGASVFTAPGAPVDEPFGVVVDPATRMIYWANNGKGTDKGSIAWARLDGSTGGLLNTTGALVDDPYKLGLDPVNGRVYWGSFVKENETVISYASVNNTGGGNLNITPPPESAYAFAVDPAAGRLYWSEGDDDRFAYTGLLGGSRNTLDTTGAVLDTSYGFAVDPTLNKIYWPNYGNNDNPVNGLGFASLTGGGGGNITPTAPFDGAQDVLVLKSPTGIGAPTVARDAKLRSALACSSGTWAADFAGSFVYQAPHTLGYQWSLNGVPIPGASATTLTATTPGRYGCTVTAANQAGAASQSSAAVVVKASKVKLSTKRKAKADPGDLVTFKLKAVNQGDIPSKAARICVKLPKAAKDDLRKPKCKKLVALTGGVKKTATVKVKVKGGADEGADKLTFQVKGTPGKAATSKIIVR